MTPSTAATQSSTTGSRLDRLDPGRALPLVLEANAATSLAAGLVATLAPRWSADRLGLGDEMWVRPIGIGLILFALSVAASARLQGDRLGRAGRAVAGLDAAWVLGTTLVIAAAGLSGTGVVIAVVMAAGVADFALAQWWLARRRPGRASAPEPR